MNSGRFYYQNDSRYHYICDRMTRNGTEYSYEGRTFHGAVPHVMGTRLEMLAVGAPRETVLQVWDWLCEESSGLMALLDRFDPESELSKANATGSFTDLSGRLKELTDLALSYRERTLGLFDVFKGGRKLDFGGFAKGYLLKELKTVLEQAGMDCAFIDFGGSSIMAVGHHPFGESWKVGVRNPFGNDILLEVELKDRSMSTSGNSPGYSGHIINPLTGLPVNERKVVTVVADDPLDAEVLSTASMLADLGMIDKLKEYFPGTRIERFFL